jgi:GAF domain-containing protein
MPEQWLASVRDGIPLTSGYASVETVLTGEAVQLGDIADRSDRFGVTAARLAASGYRACLFLPIRHGDVIWGHLGLVRRARQPFDPVGTAYLRAATAIFSLALG